MGYIIHTTDELRKNYDEITVWKISQIALTVFALAVSTDGMPKTLIMRPGNCEPEFNNDEVMTGCLDYINDEIVAEYKRSPLGGIHIYIRLAREQPQIASSQ